MPTREWRWRWRKLCSHLAELIGVPRGLRSPWANVSLRLFTSRVWDGISPERRALIDNEDWDAALADFPAGHLVALWRSELAAPNQEAAAIEVPPAPVVITGGRIVERAKECFGTAAKDQIQAEVKKNPAKDSRTVRNEMWGKLSASEQAHYRMVAGFGGWKNIRLM